MEINTIIAELQQKITNCLSQNRYYITSHAREQAVNRMIAVPVKLLKDATVNEEFEIIQVLWEYPMDCLKVKVFIPKPEFVHYGIMIRKDQIGIATVYLPNEYEEDGKTRKRN